MVYWSYQFHNPPSADPDRAGWVVLFGPEAMPLTLLAPRRIYREIAEQIAAMIASGELGPNSRLPSERDLAQRLGVSRPPVREALIALEVEGLVDVRVGSGVYVRQEAASRASTRRARKIAEIGPFELLAARRMVESTIAGQAAKNATREQIKAIAETVEAMRSDDAQHYDLRHPADRLFHVRVAEASGNTALVLMTNVLWDLRDGSLHRRIEEHFSTHALRDRSNQDHEDILNAIRKRDSAAASMLMRKHLMRVERELSRVWPAITDPARTEAPVRAKPEKARVRV